MCLPFPQLPVHTYEEGKEPYGPACRDYFWLLGRLLECLSLEFVRGEWEKSSFESQEATREILRENSPIVCNLFEGDNGLF